MRKISKLLVMALVVLAVITMSANVNASTSTLKDYVGRAHNINGMVFELKDNQKTQVLNYISTLDDATSKSIYNNIKEIETIVKNSGATKLSQIKESDRTKILNTAKAAATKAGLTLTVDTAKESFTLKKSNGDVLVSGDYKSLVTYTDSKDKNTTNTTKKSKLLYTGANNAVYAVAFVAIVAVSVAVVKKRA